MESEYIRCRRQGKTVEVYKRALANCLKACNKELDDVVAKSQKQIPREGDDDVVVQVSEVHACMHPSERHQLNRR